MKSAVLFLVFNRPDTTQIVFDAIRDAKPKRLYVASDGPREYKHGEIQQCEEVREIATAVDWPCELHTLFQSDNLGCQTAVSTAISWFFNNEPEGIILEDDCLPDPSFFRFCDELLERYRNDNKIMAISGDYFCGKSQDIKNSYYFSRYNHCWGWASWSRAWKHYDSGMQEWQDLRETNWLLNIGDGHKDFEKYWKAIFNRCYEGDINSWAYRWTYSCWLNNGLTILPKVNLVKNLGFGEQSTHTKTKTSWYINLPLSSIPFPLSHPGNIKRSISPDRWTDLHVFMTKNTNLISRIYNKLTLHLRLPKNNSL